jgi:hypothetical protein
LRQILPPSKPFNSNIPLTDSEYIQEDTDEDLGKHSETLYDIFQKIITDSTTLAEGEFEVEAVLGTRTSSIGEIEYLVSWKNYSSRSNSWVKKDDMQCSELIDKYTKANRVGTFIPTELPLLRIGERWLVPYITGILNLLLFHYFSYIYAGTFQRYCWVVKGITGQFKCRDVRKYVFF